MLKDKRASYDLARREVIPSVAHRQGPGLNNRAENNHQRLDDGRIMKHFMSAEQAQCFLSVQDQVANLICRPTNICAAECRHTRAWASQAWAAVTGVAMGFRSSSRGKASLSSLAKLTMPFVANQALASAA